MLAATTKTKTRNLPGRSKCRWRTVQRMSSSTATRSWTHGILAATTSVATWLYDLIHGCNASCIYERMNELTLLVDGRTRTFGLTAFQVHTGQIVAQTAQIDAAPLTLRQSSTRAHPSGKHAEHRVVPCSCVESLSPVRESKLVSTSQQHAHCRLNTAKCTVSVLPGIPLCWNF